MPDIQKARFDELLKEFNAGSPGVIKQREIVEEPYSWSSYRNPRHILCKCCGTAHIGQATYEQNCVQMRGEKFTPVDWNHGHHIVYGGVPKGTVIPDLEKGRLVPVGRSYMRLEAEDFDFILTWRQE